MSVIGEHHLKMFVQMQGIGPTDPVFGSHMVTHVPELSPAGVVNVSECGAHSVRLGAYTPSIINENHLGNHEIRTLVGENDKFIRDGGQWRAVETLLVKFDSQWHELDKILEKKDGVWVQIF